ncbi:zinc ribbon domain-containing protein [Cohnella lubricantis]|uniref:Zinc ribbon domain-containing protein n=2 Tax=Cohnella lubricantis TaxID=2163172 RepID=A0A841TBI8_9BACL|nr:zinc ribbon domain-containing protein [Cohnella lubricantis]MBB6676610.1 zinc ribbon domain-containing protein [Cohnella lubricantis]
MSIEEAIQSRYRCAKCLGEDCSIKEVAMTGTGLSKMFDIQHNHYLFVSCEQCGYVEVYDPDVLRGHKAGSLGTILDALFGR